MSGNYVYSFSPVTGEFTGATEAQVSPLEPGVILLPANATDLAPPEAPKGEVVVWKGGAWDIQPDNRGVEYWLADGSHHKIEEIGVLKPNEALDAPPPKVPTAVDINTEAHRRIVLICPEWKQRNLTAQAAKLAVKGQASWTHEEQAAWDAGEAIWTQIKAIRSRSDELQLSVPLDYQNDAHWA